MPELTCLLAGDVRRQLHAFHTCVAELLIHQTPFGPKRLAARLVKAIECLREAHEWLVKGSEDSGDTEEDTAQTSAHIAGLSADLYRLYLDYLLIPSRTAFPAELLLPLREELCRVGGYRAEQVAFCVRQKSEFNNECAILVDPLRTTVASLQESCEEGAVRPKYADEADKGLQRAVVVSYPMSEGRNALLHPILLHEIAHAIDAKRGLSREVFAEIADVLNDKVDDLPIPETQREDFRQRCHAILKQWTKEFCADLIATHHFGLCMLCAARLMSALLGNFNKPSDSHPDSHLRCRFMLTFLERGGYFAKGASGREGSEIAGAEIAGTPKGILSGVLAQWAGDAEEDPGQVAFPDEYVRVVRELTVEKQDLLLGEIRGRLRGEPYAFGVRFRELVTRLRDGVPPDVIDGAPASLADLFNAGWVVALEYEKDPFLSCDPQTDEELDLCYDSLNELMLKAVENSYLMRWAIERKRQPVIAAKADSIPEFAVLGGRNGVDPVKLLEAGDVVITPVLSRSQIGGASINLRVGSHFLVPKAADLPSFDTSEMGPDQFRRIQDYMNKSIGEDFVLHPGRLILGQTLEYICLPSNIAGMVLSRSRYGRLGLVVATATFVHPGWRGCLTLELGHQGDVPIRLKCGSPIAQLVLFECTGVTPAPRLRDGRAPFPTRPGFIETIDRPDQDFLAFLGTKLEQA